MNVLFVQKVKALVGSEKYFLELLPALENKGIKTSFACIYSKEDKERTLPFIQAMKERGLTIHVKEVPSDKAVLSCVRFIHQTLKTDSFDLIHSHLIHADFWCALLKKTRRTKLPLISTKHGYDEIYISKHGFDPTHLKKNLYLRMCRFSERSIDYSFAVSNGLKNLFIGAGISHPDKIGVIHHGFDLPQLEQSSSTTFRYSDKQLVLLGRIIPFKGHMYALKALKKATETHPDLLLLIIGHGDEALIAELNVYIEENGLTENVRFLGYQSNIYDYLTRSDVMLVPSIAEGFGLIFLEALNAQLPIIGFDVPATNEIIEHDKTGYLIPPYDSDKMGEAIISLINSKDKRIQFGKNGQKRLHEYFSLERMTNETIASYQRVLNPSFRS